MTSCELKRWSSDFPPSKTRVAHTRNFPPKERDLVSSCARAIVTFHIGLHEMCVRTGVLYVITKFSEEDSLPNFLTHGAPLRACEELRYESHNPLPYDLYRLYDNNFTD